MVHENECVYGFISSIVITAQRFLLHTFTTCMSDRLVNHGRPTPWLTTMVHYDKHRRNNRRDRGKLVPQLLGWGTNNVLVLRFLGRSFQKARNFTASRHQNAGFYYYYRFFIKES